MMIDEIGLLLNRRIKTKVATLAQISDTGHGPRSPQWGSFGPTVICSHVKAEVPDGRAVRLLRPAARSPIMSTCH